MDDQPPLSQHRTDTQPTQGLIHTVVKCLGTSEFTLDSETIKLVPRRVQPLPILMCHRLQFVEITLTICRV